MTVARTLISAWRLDYNERRPHSALDNLTPAEFAARHRQKRRSDNLQPGLCYPHSHYCGGAPLIDHGDVGFAVVLLTPDDEGRARSGGELNLRARQNVVLELGYFVGRLGPDRVCALRRDNVENPSDLDGVVYVTLDQQGAWQRELEAADYEIDWNVVMKGR